ncbi:MAG: hypothetical protein ACI8P0_004002 [Planctomycetaceae bacterium]
MISLVEVGGRDSLQKLGCFQNLASDNVSRYAALKIAQRSVENFSRAEMQNRRSKRAADSMRLAICHRRAGASTLDYILVLGVILPLVAFAIPAGKRIIQLTYEMVCTLVAWPIM